jgi:uncharacterized protein (TIGR03083 family)
MDGVEIAEYVAALDRDGVLLADAAEDAGLAARIPACPGWQVRDLVRHQAYVHQWAARHVRDRLPEIIDEATEADVLAGGPPDAELIAAYRAGHADLLSTLRGAAPDAACATFMPAPSPLAFWARRQAHETAIHRVDAELAGGAASPIADRLAADGIDEWLHLLSLRPQAAPLAGHGETLHLHCTDVAGEWLVRLGEAGPEIEAIHAKGDVAVRGPASDLLLVLLRRADPGTVEVLGSRPVLDGFLERVRF